MTPTPSTRTPRSTVPAPGVLGNDTDPDADPLTASLVDDVSPRRAHPEPGRIVRLHPGRGLPRRGRLQPTRPATPPALRHRHGHAHRHGGQRPTRRRRRPPHRHRWRRRSHSTAPAPADVDGDPRGVRWGVRSRPAPALRAHPHAARSPPTAGDVHRHPDRRRRPRCAPTPPPPPPRIAAVPNSRTGRRCEWPVHGLAGTPCLRRIAVPGGAGNDTTLSYARDSRRRQTPAAASHPTRHRSPNTPAATTR